jgi:hypothetical protein
MKEYIDLTERERWEVFNNAVNFLHDYSDHVHSSFDKETSSVAPSGSDMFHPELWKGIHWVWFFSERVSNKLRMSRGSTEIHKWWLKKSST